MSILTDIGIRKEFAEMIKKVAEENLKKPQVDISGYIDLMCPVENGIDRIKNALNAAGEVDGEEISVDITYTGAPRYRIHVIAPDYKKAENILKKSAQSAIEVIEKAGGTGKFYRYSEQNT
ncbi:Translation initiation factor 2 subunit alpha [uncultured archaeon]|nr:Translation initiation factor 2 subunit alpha [uncultured archaeon]